MIISTYGYNADYVIDCEDLTSAKTSFNMMFTSMIGLKQDVIDVYYQLLFERILNYADLLTVTKSGTMTLEKHKGTKESINKDEYNKMNENSKVATNTDIKKAENIDKTDTTTFGKTLSSNEVDTHARVYFGSDTLVDTDKDTKTGAQSSNAEGGTESLHTQGTSTNNYTDTKGNKANNYTETTKDEDDNYTRKTADAIANYKTITDIADNIFDKDVTNFDDYIETTTNSDNELQNFYKIIKELKDPLFVESIVAKILNKLIIFVE